MIVCCCSSCTASNMFPRIAILLVMLCVQGTAFLSPPARPYSHVRHAPKPTSTNVIRRLSTTGGGDASKKKLVEYSSTVLFSAAGGMTATTSSGTLNTSKTLVPSEADAKTGDTTSSSSTSGKQVPRTSDGEEKGSPGEATGGKEASIPSTKPSTKPYAKKPADSLSGKYDGGISGTESAPGEGIIDTNAMSDKTESQVKDVGVSKEGQTRTEQKAGALSNAAVKPSSAASPGSGVPGVREEAAGSKIKRGKKNVSAPETIVAEKVLSLLDLGLVEKDDVMAYYEALSELERTTREAKEATIRPSQNPATPSNSFPSEQNPVSLVPFPALCAALGAASLQSLHLTGDADAVASVCGGIVGAAIGGLVVVGDDPVGGFTRAVGATIARGVGFAGGWVGKEISASAAVAAGATLSAAEEALVKAPANAVGAVGRSISDRISEGVAYVLGLPGQLARSAFEGVKGALISTSEAAVKLPGGLAKKAVDAAGGAIQSRSEAAVSAVKDSPKEAVQKLQEMIDVVSSPEKVLESATSLLKRPSAGTTGQTSTRPERKAKKKVRPTVTGTASVMEQIVAMTPGDEAVEEEEPEGLALGELEAKMSTVQEALARFDAVKNRIEHARTSGAPREAVRLTRNIGADAQSDRREAVGAAPESVQRQRGFAGKPSTPPSSVTSRAAASKPRLTPETQKPIDEDRRKHVAETLLEKASQRAEEWKAGLKLAEASARRNAEHSGVDSFDPTGARLGQQSPAE